MIPTVTKARALARWGLLGLTVLVLAGCGRQPNGFPIEASDTVVRLGNICDWYNRFVDQKRQAPTDEKEFRDFVKKIPPTEALVNPGNFDQYVISPRDKQEFMIRYKLANVGRGNGTGPADGPLLAYERTGVNGKVFAVYLHSGRIELLDEEKVRMLSHDN